MYNEGNYICRNFKALVSVYNLEDLFGKSTYNNDNNRLIFVRQICFTLKILFGKYRNWCLGNSNFPCGIGAMIL